MTVLVEHRRGEPDDVDAATETRDVLLPNHGCRRSHKDERDDSAHIGPTVIRRTGRP